MRTLTFEDLASFTPCTKLWKRLKFPASNFPRFVSKEDSDLVKILAAILPIDFDFVDFGFCYPTDYGRVVNKLAMEGIQSL